jgi:hypothetical protein
VRDHAEELGGIRMGGTRKKAGRLRFRVSSVQKYIERNSPRMQPKHATPANKKPARETPPIAKRGLACEWREYITDPAAGQVRQRHRTKTLGDSKKSKAVAEHERRKIEQRVNDSAVRRGARVTLSWFVENEFLPAQKKALPASLPWTATVGI